MNKSTVIILVLIFIIAIIFAQGIEKNVPTRELFNPIKSGLVRKPIVKHKTHRVFVKNVYPMKQPVMIVNHSIQPNVMIERQHNMQQDVQKLDHHNSHLSHGLNKCVRDAKYYHNVNNVLQRKLDKVYKELYSLRESYNRAQEQLYYCKKYITRDNHVISWMGDDYFTQKRGNFV